MQTLPRLNLPEYPLRIQQAEKGLRIFDPVRKKFVALTPEEWVRQNFIQYLVNEKKYPSSLIAIETGLTYNRLNKRSDITVHDRSGGIWMIVECKRPDIVLSQETFDQAAAYNMAGKSKTRFLAITNGMNHFCCRLDYEQGRFAFLRDLPEYS